VLAATSGQAAELCEATQQRAGSPSATAKSKDGDQKPRSYWWMDPKDRAELGITDQQSALVEQEWQKTLPKLREKRAQLEKLEAALDQLLARDGGDEAAIAAQIDRVETVRSEGNKARTLMIYRMNRVLTVDQRAKVKAMMDKRAERRDGGRRGGSSSR
jgi:Spy/CpxP family protein refolding chaperone